jgi:hypothetical protein
MSDRIAGGSEAGMQRCKEVEVVNKELIVKSGSGLPDNSHDKTLSMFEGSSFRGHRMCCLMFSCATHFFSSCSSLSSCIPSHCMYPVKNF